jgi:hypothetical protein
LALARHWHWRGTGAALGWAPPPERAPGCRLVGPAPHRLDPHGAGGRRRHALEPATAQAPDRLAAHLDGRGAGQTHEHRTLHRTLLWPRLLALWSRSLVSLFGPFRLQRPPLAGWTAVETRVALTYAATVVVGLAAPQAGRPDLIRSPTRVLAQTCEGLLLGVKKRDVWARHESG